MGISLIRIKIIKSIDRIPEYNLAGKGGTRTRIFVCSGANSQHLNFIHIPVIPEVDINLNLLFDHLFCKG